MDTPAFDIDLQLEGWRFFWARLEVGTADAALLEARRSEAAAAARRRFADTDAISSDPVVAALRRLFREAGCDPTRYRPSSEALIRRLVKGDDLPGILPLVDVNNCLSAALAVPCCVMVEGAFRSPLVFRAGRAGEAYESLRGPFNVERKPVLADPDGLLDTPITGNVRVKVEAGTAAAWLAAYLPADAVEAETADATLSRILDQTGVRATQRWST